MTDPVTPEPDYEALIAELRRWASLSDDDDGVLGVMTAAAAAITDLRRQLAEVTHERDTYKRAKEENDERFMLERDAAREESARLAAVIEAIRSCVDGAVLQDGQDGTPVDQVTIPATALDRILDSSPAAVLAEVKAQALEEASESFGENQMTREGDVKEWLLNRAQGIRAEQEGGE